MTIVRTASGKRRSIVERKLRRTLSKLNRCFKGVNFSPKLDDFLFLLWEIELGSYFDHESMCGQYM